MATLDSEEPQLVLPKGRIATILAQNHAENTAGHYGVEKTLRRVAARFYWPTLRKDVFEFVKNCIDCQRYKPSNTKPAGLLQTPVPALRFEILAVDLVGPLPTGKTGERWILAIEDTASKWIELFALKDATAENCAKMLINEVFLRYGTPRKLVSDNGVQFVAQVMQYVTHCLGIKQCLIPVYHPSSNPQERRNRDVKTQLAIFTENCHQNWAENLPALRFAMNSAVHSSTSYSPAFLTFGRELRAPHDTEMDFREAIEHENFVPEFTPYLNKMAEVLRDAHIMMEVKRDRGKQYADKKFSAAPTFEPGDRVLVDTHVLSNATKGIAAKLAPRRDGPYVILRQVSPTSYEIADTTNPDTALGKYHVSAIRHFHTSEEDNPTPMLPLRRRGRPPKKTH